MYNAIKAALRYAVQGSDTTMMHKAVPSFGQLNPGYPFLMDIHGQMNQKNTPILSNN